MRCQAQQQTATIGLCSQANVYAYCKGEMDAWAQSSTVLEACGCAAFRDCHSEAEG